MLMIGVDYHPSVQQIAFTDNETGEFGERQLNHSDGEAEKFYRELKQRGVSVRVGIEAAGYTRKTVDTVGIVIYECDQREEIARLPWFGKLTIRSTMDSPREPNSA